jgi:NADPH:quinone reductase-like Zn-dependent oxidoreductase
VVTSTAVVAVRRGGPEVLRVERRPVPTPARGQAVVRVLAATVSLPDVQARYGRTPFPPRVPFVPGYAVVGDVVARGDKARGVSVGDRVGVLSIVGGYAEHLLAEARLLIPVPASLDPVLVAPLVLNYLVAHQVLHRVARVRAGDPVVVVGASGGIGTALLDLGQLAGLRTYGLASGAKHQVVRRLGATPVDYRTEDFVEVVGRAEPRGVAAVLDGVGGTYVDRGLPLLARGGTYVLYGNPLSRGALLGLLRRLATVNLAPDGRRLRVYGTTSSLRHRRPFEEDWATLMRLLEEGTIEPVIERTFPLGEAAAANDLLESGRVVGNLVLVTPAYERPGGERPGGERVRGERVRGGRVSGR